MRNLLTYPVTSQEISDYLHLLSAKQSAEMLCGDMGPLLLRSAATIVEREAEIATKLRQIVAAMRNSTDDVPAYFIGMIEAAIPPSNDLGIPF